MLDGSQVLSYRQHMWKPPKWIKWSVGPGKYVDVTERQAEVLTRIGEYVDANDSFPSVREVAKLMGCSSSNGVHDVFTAMVIRGAMVRTGTGGYALVGRRRSDLLRRIEELEGRIADALT